MRGTTVQLAVKTSNTTDDFGAPIETEELVDVADVLVGTPSEDDVKSALDMYGKTVAYVLGIPKGDSHVWYDTDVIIWGERFRTIGYPVTGEQANIPLRWGSNIKVERYG